MDTNKKALYISVLNVLACLCVIILHANSIFWSHPSGHIWYTANFIEVTCFWAVPIFFMISGATLLGYRSRYDTKTFLKKRFSKTLLPFVFWSFVSYLYEIHYDHIPIDRNPLHVIDNIFNSRYFSVYWFFLPLFAVYLSIPILSNVEDKMHVYGYACILGMIFVAALPLVSSLLKISFNGQLTPPLVGGYLLFVMLGYYFSRADLNWRKRAIIYILGAAGWAMHYFGVIIMSAGQEKINGTFKGYRNLPSVLYAIAIFVFFRYLPYNKLPDKAYAILQRTVFSLSDLTFGIYLVHFFLIRWIPDKFNFNIGSMRWRIGGALFIFAISAIFVAVIKKIPFLRKLVP